jgi:pyruvate/2-oxoglutarate/acetoin dehydrogenase E1 component
VRERAALAVVADSGPDAGLGGRRRLGDVPARRGIAAEVLHLTTVVPIDQEAIVAAARQTGFVVTIEEQDLHGGLGAS